MTLKGFLLLFVVTVAAVMGGAVIAERLVEPGFARGIVIAIVAGLVVFPTASWAEGKGWIRGNWSPDKALREAAREQQQRQEQPRTGTSGASSTPGAAGTSVPSDAPPASGSSAPSSTPPHSTGDPR